MFISKFLGMLALVCALVPASVAAMSLNIEGLSERLRLHLKEVHGCEQLQFEQDHAVGKDGWFFAIKNETTIDVVMQLDGEKVSSLEAASADQSNQALEDMMCLTVATMRALQPDAIDTYDAFYEAAFFWGTSKHGPFKKAFFTDMLSVQYEPYMFRFE